MSHLAVSPVLWPVYEHDLAPGDIVSLGDLAGSLYQVVAVRDEKVWVKGVVQGTGFLAEGSDYLVSVQRCRRVGPNAADTLH